MRKPHSQIYPTIWAMAFGHWGDATESLPEERVKREVDAAYQRNTHHRKDCDQRGRALIRFLDRHGRPAPDSRLRGDYVRASVLCPLTLDDSGMFNFALDDFIMSLAAVIQERQGE